MLKRLVAMLAVTALVAGSTVFYYHKTGIRTDGIFYEASGIRPDAPVMHVNGDAVSAEEYLYWLDSVCAHLASYVGGAPDFSAKVTDEMTLGQFAKEDAAHTVTLYAVVRQIAAECGITLSDEDFAALDAQRQQYVSYYGSEEAYLQQLQVLGLSEEMLHRIEEVPYLYHRALLAFSDPAGKLYPGEEALRAYADENGFVTAQLLYFPTAGLTEAEQTDMKAKAADYAAQLQAAADKQATYEMLAAQLGLTVSADGLTFCAADADPIVHGAVADLAAGQISSVVQGSNGYYVAMRMDTNYAALTEDLFNIYLQDRQDSAKVEYNDKYFGRLDAGAFYTSLLKARSLLLENLSGQAN